MKHYKYSSIGQFRNLVKDMAHYYEGRLPVLEFTGTTKVHGTNSSVIITPDGKQYPQSRNNILYESSDNCGFAAWHKSKEADFESFIKLLPPQTNPIVIYGEWAGRGIQKGVAVSEVEKFFYIFGVKVVTGDEDGQHIWLAQYPELTNGTDIIDSRSILHSKIIIDFNDPQAVQNTLVKLTEAVEKECPVGKHFGVEGIGEGIVWEHITDEGEKFCCKVKGEKHSVSKVKKLAEVDTEKMNSIKDFIDYAVTDNRLEQAFKEVCNNNPDRKLLGSFIKWISSDVNKEEADTLADSDLTMKDVGSPLSKRARDWFFSKELV